MKNNLINTQAAPVWKKKLLTGAIATSGMVLSPTVMAAADVAAQALASQSTLSALFNFIPNILIFVGIAAAGLMLSYKKMQDVDKKAGFKEITRQHSLLIKKIQAEIDQNKEDAQIEIKEMRQAKGVLTYDNQINKIPNTIDTESQGYEFLRGHKKVQDAYLKVSKQAALMQGSLLSERDKERAAELNLVAGKVLFSLKTLNDIGGLNIDLNSDKYDDNNPSPAMKAQKKMQEVLEQMNALAYKQADRIGSSIDSLTLPESHELQDEFEQLKIDGSALLSIIKYKDTAVSKESEFVLRKVVDTRLDEMWEEYSRGKSAFTPKETDGKLDLSKSNQGQTPDEIIREVFSLVRDMYADIENSIKTSKEETAIRDLLATKDYFIQRGKS